MSNTANVVRAIESFDSWTRPWEFSATISASLASEPSEVQMFEQIWAVACDRRIWLSADSLASGVAAAESALLEDFPWLSMHARRQLSNGASYQWR